MGLYTKIEGEGGGQAEWNAMNLDKNGCFCQVLGQNLTKCVMAQLL
jgi:hypothetical protein